MAQGIVRQNKEAVVAGWTLHPKDGFLRSSPKRYRGRKPRLPVWAGRRTRRPGRLFRRNPSWRRGGARRVAQSESAAVQGPPAHGEHAVKGTRGPIGEAVVPGAARGNSTWPKADTRSNQRRSCATRCLTKLSGKTRQIVWRQQHVQVAAVTPVTRPLAYSGNIRSESTCATLTRQSS